MLMCIGHTFPCEAAIHCCADPQHVTLCHMTRKLYVETVTRQVINWVSDFVKA
jgi:hypothetical protein